MSFLSKLLIVIGVLFLCISLFFVYQRHNPMRLAFADITSQNAPTASSIMPSRLVIESIGVDLPIHPAEIENNKWSDTKSGVSYLQSSPIPGNSGNSIVYGHNWPGLLGKLTQVIPGEEIKITFSDGSVRTFVIEFTTTVDPSQTGVLANSNQKRLTVYTCTGFLDSKRFVATAFPVEDK